MIDASYWWDEATKFMERARAAEDRCEQQECLELAGICEDLLPRSSNARPAAELRA
jgi:hypothetical protein